jgi:hypothetical protein
MSLKSFWVAAVLALMGSVTPQLIAQESRHILLPVSVGGKSGFIDRTGRVVVKPLFDEVKDFSEGLAAVRLGLNWGYIDESGYFTIPLQFAWAENFSDGFAVVSKGQDSRGLIDHNGSFSIFPENGWPYGFSEGLVRVGFEKNRVAASFWSQPTSPEQWIFFNPRRIAVIHPEFDYVDDFHEGFALVARRAKDRYLVNYINKQGILAFDEWFMAGHAFSEGVAIVSSDPNGFTYNHYGRLIYDSFNDGPVGSSPPNKPIDFLIVDRAGNKASVGTLENILNFSEGLVAIQIGGKWGYMNKRRQIGIKPRFDAASDFSEGLASVIEGNDHYYISARGKRILSVECDNAGDFHHGLARIRISDKIGYIDRSGRVVWSPTK